MRDATATALPPAGSDLERAFETLWRVLDGPPLEREYRFAYGRRWRADFAHLPARVLIELEGGVWTGGRHTRGGGFEADAEKYNAATLDGWRVFRLTAGMLDDPDRHVAPIVALCKGAPESAADRFATAWGG